MSGLKLKTRGELWLAAGMRRFYATFARRLEQGPAPDFAAAMTSGLRRPCPSPRPYPASSGPTGMATRCRCSYSAALTTGPA